MAEQMFVARQAQLAELRTFLDQALANHGQVAFVVGEAGSGKTALITEFARRAQEAHKDLVFAIGNCNAQTGIGDPYLPFREILAQLTGDVEAKLAQGAITAENARRLRGLVGLTIDTLVKFGPDLINVLVPGSALVAKVGAFVAEKVGWPEKLKKLVESKAASPAGAALEQSHIFEQTTNVLRALVAQKPLVLVLDDLQWADSASISLLFHLGRRIGESRLLMLGAYRPEEVELGRGGERHPLEKVLAEFKRYFGDVWVDLDQAEKEEARQFVDALLDLEPNRLGPSFRQALVQHTGGHPLFAVELLRDMQEEGHLQKDAQGCWTEGASLDWDALPPRVEGVIEERIGRLQEELRETLTVGSVEGEQFTAEVIARVRKVDERAVVGRLSNQLDRQHHLVVSQGMRRLGRQMLSSYRFRHNLFQKYMYSRLDAAQRAYLHEDVGNVLETLYGDQAAEIAVQLARHFEEAGLAEKAIHYLRLAGEQARRRYANTEAITHFRRALALLADAPPDASRQRAACELSEKLGDVLFLIGQNQDARAAYAAALPCVPQEDLVWQSRLQRQIGKTWERQRIHTEALRAYNLAETTLREEPAESPLGWWQEWVAIQIDRIRTTYWNGGEYPELADLAEKARAAVEQYGTPAQRSSFYECLVVVNSERDRYAVGEDTVIYAQAALAASQESGDLGKIASSQFCLGFSHLWLGNLDEAGKEILAALTMAEHVGDIDLQFMCLTFLSVFYRKRGQVEEVRRLMPRSLALARERQSVEWEGIAEANLAWVALREGSLGEAQLHGQAALELWRPPVKLAWKWLALWPLVRVRLAWNQVSAAIDCARALLKPDQQPLPATLTSVIERAITAWEMGGSETARTHLDRALELAQELGYL